MPDTLHKWKLTGLIATLAIVLLVPVYLLKEAAIERARVSEPGPEASFVGKEKCVKCHEKEYKAWQDSDHDNAMAVAADSTVRGDFNNSVFAHESVSARFFKRDGKFFVNTEGPGGEPDDFEITHTFGWEPLQQYLIPFPGGRLQCLTIAWDTEQSRWFYLYPDSVIQPDDWLHWTRGAQNWNGMCAECHSTDLQKNYDAQTQTFSTTWSEINVSCEACHGPGSRHVEWAEIPPMARPDTENYELAIRTGDIESRQQVELCAPCHSRRMELGDYDHTRTEILNNVVPTVLEEGLYHADGQILDEVYVYGSFTQSKMFGNDVRCSDCHDVHSLKLVREGNDLCLQCHQAEVYDSYDHHFHKREHEGKPSDGYLCVKCHMAEQPFMVIDWRADHSLRVPRPDLTLEIGTPNACSMAGCHNDKPDSWSAEHYTKWYGQAKKPHYGTILAAGREHSPEVGDKLIRLAGDDLYPTIVRATALQLLGAYPGDATMAAFNRALSDPEPLVRYTAVLNVNIAEPERLKELVAPLLFDPVLAVRMQAAVRLAVLPRELFKPYQQEALEKTLIEYETAMTYSLDFSFAGHNLGNLYMTLDDPKRAEASYKAAIEIDGLFYPAKTNLAVLYNAQGRNKEAEKLLREIVEDYPDQFESAYSLGLLLAEMNNLEEAAVYLRKGAEGLPDRGRVWYNLGLVEQALGRIPAAERALLAAVEVDPGNIEFLFALADHYIKHGELLRARAVAEQMIEIQPDNKAGHDIKTYVDNLLNPSPRSSN